ncbi:two-component system, OmpR family, osmolarity sensor histidine kinase EnvZ [Mameliella alba]|uniref:ATP-binding protein n=1 Tax=Mameliella alba TaxID=561184 RepID=UPI00088DD324|nr:ATP-binding protein [Mameliella alba]OWV50046.1 two-component sensor histidine kinase [Mameliella alba]PTR42574.1 two-component system osmolarity sensor histidine kinase EnvZ [Mameliella alba]GGF71993.1 two-component sensor histidine kinase [Mameliella alba]SDC16174.1 two-component system, OmpR family, osmolarity sensor histidine kinase EnvZ [Mameliella alba]
MFFRWLKRYMPRSLYGRAALILVLPVVTLQLVVSVVFIQRHFEGVTVQMSKELAREVNLVVADLPDRSNGLRLSIRPKAVAEDALPAVNQRRWYDFTGLVVIRELDMRIPTLERILLPSDREVVLFLRHDDQLYRASLERSRVSASNPHQLFVNMVFFGALMTLIAFLYMRNQLRPITRLAAAAEAFGKGRNMRYSPAGATEVRAAGHAFLEMRDRIERHIEQRTMMLSGVSHDLRTPMTRLRLGLSLLDDEDREPLERDVEEMQQLIDAFLDFARGDAETAASERTDPFTLIKRVVEDAQRGGQKVELGEMQGEGTAMLRPRALRRAVENLMANARRYASDCRVSVQLTGGALRIRVEDDGPGIPADRREDALRPFVRLDPARNQDRGSGVGLGLAIAADIARAHGGVLRLGESESLGGLRADIVIAL